MSDVCREPPADLGGWCDCDWLGVTFVWHQWEHKYTRLVRNRAFPRERRYKAANVDIKIGESTLRLIKSRAPETDRG